MRKCKAGSAVENGFIFAVDSPRCFAALVVNRATRAGRRHVRHARKYEADTPLVDGFISGFDSPRLSPAQWS
jgi:hypothetical protein